MTKPIPPLFRALVALLFALVLAALPSVALAASAEVPAKAGEAPRKSFDVPAGDASAALKQFAAQSGVQLLYSTQEIGGVRTQPVKGSLTVQEALDAMLAETGLVAARDAKTGAFAVRKGNGDPDPNAARAIATASDRPGSRQTMIEGTTVQMAAYEVTGSRIPLTSGEQLTQPVLSYTASDIERTGATTLGQFWQYIPSLANYSTGDLSTSATGDFSGGQASSTGNRTFATIRGGTGFGGTLMLVNGKRVPRTNQQQDGSVAQDLGGIPLAAIERIDVLLDGASAVYGADAMTGVINVILRKRYAGTEVRLTYDNTFEQDAGQWTASLTHGFSRGKWSGLLTVSGTENNIMLMTDRAQTASFDRTLYGGTSTGIYGANRIGATGSVSVASGSLPGVGAQFASIPANASGQNLSVAAFAAAGYPSIDASPGQMGATAYVRQRSGLFRLGYEVSERLQIEGHVRLGRSRQWDNGVYRRALNLALPATYPGNPFGVPIRLNKIFYDLPRLVKEADSRNDEFALSAAGKIAGDWRYETAANFARTVARDLPPTLGTGAYAVANLQASALNAAIAAGRAPNLLYDSTRQSPNAATNLNEFFVQALPSALSDDAQIWTYSMHANGTAFTWAAGPVRAAAGVEYRQEYYDSPDALNTTRFPTPPNRDYRAAFVELGVPLVRPEWNWLGLHRVDFNYALRIEDTVAGRATSPRYGLSWRPRSWLLLRGSRGEGFLPPTINQANAPVSSLQLSATASTQPIDPLRGNESFLGRPLAYVLGGNPDLKPERSENWTYGVVLDVPRVRNLQLSFDYFDNEYYDRPGTLSLFPDMFTHAPQLIIRGANLPGDQPGWPGPVAGVYFRFVNMSYWRSAGYNFGARWTRSTPWGDFTVATSGDRVLADEARLFPTSAPLANANKRFRQMRATTSARWSRGPWEAGVTHLYGGKVWVNSTNATLAASRYTDPVERWDANVSCDLGRYQWSAGANDSWWRRLLRDSRVSVSVINVLNTEPPLNVNGFASNSVIDPRLRRYVLDLTTRF